MIDPASASIKSRHLEYLTIKLPVYLLVLSGQGYVVWVYEYL